MKKLNMCHNLFHKKSNRQTGKGWRKEPSMIVLHFIIPQCQMGIEVPQSLILSMNSITAFIFPRWDRNAMRSGG
jgi:hypothetical protein